MIRLTASQIIKLHTQKDLYTVILDVAAGQKGYEDLLDWILEKQI